MASLDFGLDFGAAQKIGQGRGSVSDFSSFKQTAPTEPTLPSWLPTSPDAMNQELRSQYGKKRPGLFGAVEAGKAIDNMQQFNLSTGTTMANNAAQDYAQRAMQQGGTAINAGTVKAQAMMPVLQQNAALGLEKQDRLTQARMKAADMKANLAGAINQSRLGYLSNLASTYTTMRGQNITQDYQRQLLGNSSGGGGAGGAGARVGGGFGVGGPTQISPGYVPNAGPANWAQANGQDLRGHVINPGAIPALGGQIAAPRY